MTPILPIWSLTQREIVRFLRQRSRVTGAFAQPIIFWVLFGVGLGGSFRMPGAADGGLSYQAYFIPGIAAMIVLFTSIFSSISVIQDRNEGFLQGVLAAPVPRTSLVLGKILGGTLLAFVQAVLFIGLALVLKATGLFPSLAFSLGVGQFLATSLVLLMMGLGLCGLGFMFAWRLDSVQGFHAIMSILLFPMWLMSGAFFPSEGSGWLQWVMAINPLTYGVAALRRIMFPESSQALPSLWVCVALTILFAVVMVAVDTALARRPQT
ncbi:MAG: ABC transporter permease [Planctomycetaceae bacterium]